ncbi:hypothetical protein TNIN_308731 [Trichonephila inaurata madagascariensis]|uniref:Uncharacterized protein n=1 Tax=Trichonephila inaurata madagascariensis TaxID=2747483 RepID=A0A8X6WTC7_9ARAC|nr:hypothetical protein TNIN_308731 [Trichonephila inaurata madagascariensis]
MYSLKNRLIRRLEMKRKEIAEQKQLLSIVQEKDEPVQEPQEQVSEKRPELSEDNLSFVKQWMECKISSKKEYYEYLIEEVRNKTEVIVCFVFENRTSFYCWGWHVIPYA